MPGGNRRPAMASRWAGVSAATLVHFCNSPLTRTRGGWPARRWMSEALLLAAALMSWSNVMARQAASNPRPDASLVQVLCRTAAAVARRLGATLQAEVSAYRQS